MKKIILILFVSTLTIFNSFSQTVSTNTCISTGGSSDNVFIYVNYDGGVLNINVDQNIPNLKIGVCTYEPVTINLSGPFVGNVTEVRYAGYVSTTNNHCSNSPTTTTIVGAPGGAATSVNFLPPATLSNPNGNGTIVCGYSCNTTTNQGGCNTADQIQDYFLTTMGGTLNSYYTQYGCWPLTAFNLSTGGNCFTSPAVNDTTITTFSTSASTVCEGIPVNFTDLSPGAVSWSWTAPGGSVTSSSSQNFSGVVYNTAGSYTVTLTTNDGDGTCSTTQTITVLPEPNLNLSATPNPICPGDTADLFVSGANTYQWVGGPADDDYAVNPSTSTWYNVTGTDIMACTSTDSVQVIVYAAPSTPTINYSGGILTASPTALSYQWYLDGNPISLATNQNYTPTQNGVYTVTYTDANGCTSSASLPTTVSDIGAGMTELENNKLNVYPNPGTGIFQISIPNTSGNANIEVFDILGKLVYFREIQFLNSYTLDLTDQPKGAYEVRMTMHGKTGYSKIILK